MQKSCILEDGNWCIKLPEKLELGCARIQQRDLRQISLDQSRISFLIDQLDHIFSTENIL